MTQYSTMQKVSLAGIVIGALMCWVGAASPYWIVSDPKGFSGLVSLVGKVVKGYMGLFMYCVEILGEEHCEAIDMDGRNGWFHTARMCAAGCLLLGGLAGLVSLCLACCTCCKRFIPVGFLAFFGAAAGAIGSIVFFKNTDVFTSTIVGFQVTTYGWGFYLFTVGVGILGIMSFIACFAAPENPMRGMVLGHAGPTVIVSSGSQPPYMNLQEQSPPPMVAATAPQGVTMMTSNGY